MAGYDRLTDEVESVDQGLILVPFCWTSAGSGTPTLVLGDQITGRTVTRTGAGVNSFTLFNLPYAVVGGGVSCSSGAAEDIVPHLDASLANTTGVVTVRTMTGTTPTDLASGGIVYGHLICAKTDRRAG